MIDADNTGAPREITPQAGDTFTLLDKWFEGSSSVRINIPFIHR
jgi:hypothetical protein